MSHRPRINMTPRQEPRRGRSFDRDGHTFTPWKHGDSYTVTREDGLRPWTAQRHPGGAISAHQVTLPTVLECRLLVAGRYAEMGTYVGNVVWAISQDAAAAVVAALPPDSPLLKPGAQHSAGLGDAQKRKEILP